MVVGAMYMRIDYFDDIKSYPITEKIPYELWNDYFKNGLDEAAPSRPTR